MSIGMTKACDWLSSVEQQKPQAESRWRELYGESEAVIQTRRPLYVDALRTFIDHFGTARDALISRAPGRINLLGNHIEHRGGTVNYMAVDRETLLVASPRSDDRVVLRNTNPGRFPDCEFVIGDLLPPDRRGAWLDFLADVDVVRGDWMNYIAAAVLALQDISDRDLTGMDLAVNGDIPIGAGLSSSSSLVVSALEAMLVFNDLDIPEDEKAVFCGNAEWYVGTRGGAGDHAAMLHAKRQAVLRLRFFPLLTEEIPFPDGYRIVACNSFVEHQSTSVFNERIATYEIGLMLAAQAYPQYADSLAHLRDLNAEHLGVDDAGIFGILKDLPVRMSREEIRRALPAEADRLDSLFAPHDEPKDGYRVRQVVLFGLAECARGRRCGDLLKAGRIAEMGDLKYLSHDGDRVVRHTNGVARPVDNRIDDDALDRLIADLESGDEARSRQARMHNQPGGYDCSCEELDLLVDLARDVPGVAGAGLAGGGLGGCVLAMVEETAVETLKATLNKSYYEPRGLENGLLVCSSVAGSGIV